METMPTASAPTRRLPARSDPVRRDPARRSPATLGLLLALALWAILVIVGSAVALAAGPGPTPSSASPSSSSGSAADDSSPAPMKPGATMPGATAGAGMSGAPTDTDPGYGTPTYPAESTTLAPGQTAPGQMGPGTMQTDMPAADSDDGRDLDSLLGPEPPTRVRVAILNATGKTGGANKVAVLLGEYKRQALEDQIGLQIEVVNLSNAEGVRPGQSVLFYRPEFLRAALAMAKAIPGEQSVEPMRPAGLKRAGVDVEIVVGKELP